MEVIVRPLGDRYSPENALALRLAREAGVGSFSVQQVRSLKEQGYSVYVEHLGERFPYSR